MWHGWSHPAGPTVQHQTKTEALLRFFVYGPLLGAGVGIVQTIAAVTVWVSYGTPDFYFRGWSGVEFQLIGMTAGGGLVGIPFGLLLLAYEKRTKRRVRIGLFLPFLLGMAFVIGNAIVWYNFATSPEMIWFPLAPIVTAITLGLLLAFALSKNVEANDRIQKEDT